MHHYNSITRRAMFYNKSHINTTNTNTNASATHNDLHIAPSVRDYTTPHPIYKHSNMLIESCASMTLDLESYSTDQSYYAIELTGRYYYLYKHITYKIYYIYIYSWGRENSISETHLTSGSNISIGSTRGVSSHQHNPFLALCNGPPSETRGEVKGFSLLYSGNFQIQASMNEVYIYVMKYVYKLVCIDYVYI